jgi:hypothetical protein
MNNNIIKGAFMVKKTPFTWKGQSDEGACLAVPVFIGLLFGNFSMV